MPNVPFPTTIDLALTGKCNLRCKHCNTSGTWDLRNEFSFEEIIDVLDQLKEGKVFGLNLFGGEPFCYERIFDLLEKLNDYPMRVSVLTNGTLIDETAVKYLKKMKFLGIVQVSLDGSTPDIHDWQRGNGSFARSLKAVKLMVENSLPVTMKAIINRHNCDDIPAMVELARSAGLRSMGFGDAVECGRAAVYAGDMSLEGQTHLRIMNSMFALKRRYPEFGFGGTLAQKTDMLADFYKKGPEKGTRGTFSTCGAGNTILSIRSDGKVVPCSTFWTLVCGDVREKKLKDIWENSAVLNDIRGLAKEPLDKYKEECKRCDYLSYCNGGCRAAAYYSSGNDLKGIEEENCLVFSGVHGFRVSKDTVQGGGR